MDNFPRLLVATEFPPNASGGGPAVIRQMLKNWPVEQLLWWSCLAERRPAFGQHFAAHRVANIPAKLYPHRKFCRQKSWLMENVWSRWAAHHFQQTLKRYEPDIVWIIPHAWAIPPLATTLPRSTIGFHTTVQDYIDSHINISKLGSERCGRLANAMTDLYAQSTTRDATSHPMIDDLQKKTQQSAAQMLHAGLEPRDFELLSAKSERIGEPIRIGYAGTIIAEETFALFVSALQELRRAPSQKRQIELHFFSDHSYRTHQWFDPAWMTENGELPAAELSDRLRKCTWGFAPMDLTDDNPQYNRFSFPTKFITYLAAGLPIIALGHRQSSVIKMARAYNVGLCSDATTVIELTHALRAAFSMRSPDEIYAEEIARCARAEFDAIKMRKTLYGCFDQCVLATRKGRRFTNLRPTESLV
jgi:hypothetical protein